MRICLPEGARWYASVPPPAPVPMMITSNWFSWLMTVSFRNFRQLPILRAHGGAGVQRCGAEIHAEALTPNGHGTIFRQVRVSGNVVILIADVALDGTQLQEASLPHGLTVARVVGSYEIDMHIRAVRSFEVGETENAFSIHQLIDARGALGIVGDAVEGARSQYGLRCVRNARGHCLIDLRIYKQPLGPECGPQSDCHNYRHAVNQFLAFHDIVSLRVIVS